MIIRSSLYVLYLIALIAICSFVRALNTHVHPECQIEANGELFERIEDISALLHGSGIPTGVCIFNPSVTRLQGDLFLWAARAYRARQSSFDCGPDPRAFLPSITGDGWRGSNSLVLAVTRTIWNPDGGLNHTLVGSRQVEVAVEDGRLFKDGDGYVWLLAYVPKGGLMAAAPVEVYCADEGRPAVQCDLDLGGMRLLWYTEMRKGEKTWVPHNGTTRMSYPIQPTFAPHSVLDWGSYHEPLVKDGFDSVASNDTFFIEVNRLFDGLLEFGGSTPAILYDDGVSYLAVGHVRAAAVCFHDPANPSAAVQRTCEAFAAVRSGRMRRIFFQYMYGGSTYPHHFNEYAFFFYRFYAKPPYEITHISFGYIPCSYYHSGVLLPGGLERIGPNGTNYLISYGEANRYSRLLTISAANVRKVLVPIEQMRLSAQSYSLCSAPCTTFDGGAPVRRRRRRGMHINV